MLPRKNYRLSQPIFPLNENNSTTAPDPTTLPSSSPTASETAFTSTQSIESYNDKSFCSEDGDALSAFGDAFRSDIFVAPYESPLRNRPATSNESSKTSSPMPKHAVCWKKERPLPSVIQNIFPPSPTAAKVSSDADFEPSVRNLRDSRASDENQPSRKLVPLVSAELAPSPQPCRMTDLATRVLNIEFDTQNSAAQRSLHLSFPKPKPRNTGVKRLHARPALPCWEVHSSVEDSNLRCSVHTYNT